MQQYEQMLQKHSTVCGAAESARALLALGINQNVLPYFRTAEGNTTFRISLHTKLTLQTTYIFHLIVEIY